MKIFATVDAMRRQKDQYLRIVEMDKALTRLEANKDYKVFYDFLFKEVLLMLSADAYNIHYADDFHKRNEKLVKALSRTRDYLEEFHEYAEDCANKIKDLSDEILKIEAEE